MPSFARELEQTLHNALGEASKRRHEYATLEHLLIALIDDEHASKVMTACGVSRDELQSNRGIGTGLAGRGGELNQVIHRANPALRILGVVITMHDKRTALARDIRSQIQKVFDVVKAVPMHEIFRSTAEADAYLTNADALFDQASTGRPPVESSDNGQGRRTRWLRTVDFSRPSKFGIDQQRRLRRIMEVFCASAATRLSAEHAIAESKLRSTSSAHRVHTDVLGARVDRAGPDPTADRPVELATHLGGVATT